MRHLRHVWLVALLGMYLPCAQAQVSPATQQMVFMYLPAGKGSPPAADAPYQVALSNLDGSDFVQVTTDATQKFLPHLSPDGTKIAYTKFLKGGYGSANAVTDVAVWNLATGKETMVTSGGVNGYATWSPDGSQIAFLHNARLGATAPGLTALTIVNADGSNSHTVVSTSGQPDDLVWGDIAWSKQGWILFSVGQANGTSTFCNSRVDKILPNGTSRTQVSNGGPDCTPSGGESTGDADPGWSSDGTMIYSSRGFLAAPAGPTTLVSAKSAERKLYAFSSNAYATGKVEKDLSLPSEPGCIEGVPKGSPDGTKILLYRACFDTGVPVMGIYVTNTTGSYRTFVTPGFGPDWNPVAAR